MHLSPLHLFFPSILPLPSISCCSNHASPPARLIILHFNPQEKSITMVTQFPRARNEIIITKPCSHLFLFSPVYRRVIMTSLWCYCFCPYGKERVLCPICTTKLRLMCVCVWGRAIERSNLCINQSLLKTFLLPFQRPRWMAGRCSPAPR